MEVKDSKHLELFHNYRNLSHFISMNQLEYQEQMVDFTNKFDGYIFNRGGVRVGIKILKELFEEIEKIELGKVL